MLSTLIEFRKELHRNPELSDFEEQTAQRIENFIKEHYNTKVIKNIGGHGLVAIYDFPEEGPSIGIRCELDALPIFERNNFRHQSLQKGISHKCGHDGHMAMVLGLIFWLKKQKFNSGKVVLIFQPAEETGKGAYKMMNDEHFKDIKIDYLFALHNIPGEESNEIIVMPKNFSAEVQSFAVKFSGKKSHAAEPENGTNPAIGISRIIQRLSELNISDVNKESFSVLTPVHILLGEKSYGISPGTGELHYTIRTWSTQEMEVLEQKIIKVLNQECQSQNLSYSIEWFEYFPSTKNDIVYNEKIIKAAQKNNFILNKKSYPFKFGEDFGWFSKRYKVAMFGLGAGMETPALHHEDYDFPDEIMETGIKMFQTIIEDILES